MAVNYGVGGFVSSTSKVLGQDGFQAITGTATGVLLVLIAYILETSQIGRLTIIDRNGEPGGTGLDNETLPAGTYLLKFCVYTIIKWSCNMLWNNTLINAYTRNTIKYNKYK